MALIQKLTGKVLLQIGDNDPVEIGTVEIPIEISTQPKPTNPLNYPPGVRGVTP